MDFEKIKIKIRKFVEEELFSLEPWIINVGWKEKLPKLNDLRKKVKDMGLAFKEEGAMGGIYNKGETSS